MPTILAFINATVLAGISGIHFYWMFGGVWGLAQSLPTTTDGKKVLNPRAFECAVVAVILLAMAIFFLHFAGITLFKFPNWILKYGIGVLSGIFLLRAVGDFKYVGFTKTIRSTEFALLDTRLYAPLCLFLGLSSGIIAYYFS